ncbi:small nuclear ribonucleoprotein 35kDa [Umbelopsis sp. PMI_123]|nr:small nuclear ribonucleoprotein 35kDa [Umbelopsis sp. PMI_123]
MWYSRIYDPVKAGSIDGTDTEPHDAAIVRALNAEYKPSRHIDTNPLKTLFVGRLDPDTTEDTLKKAFGEYGTLQCVRLMYNFVTGTSKGYAFVTYERTTAAEDAYRRANGIYLDGRRILVDYERSRVMKGWVPRRLGGGFSGKKESGQLRFGARDRPFRDPINLGRHGQQLVEIPSDQRYDDNWRYDKAPHLQRSKERSPSRYNHRRERNSYKRTRSRSRSWDRHRHRSPSPYHKRRR